MEEEIIEKSLVKNFRESRYIRWVIGMPSALAFVETEVAGADKP